MVKLEKLVLASSNRYRPIGDLLGSDGAAQLKIDSLARSRNPSKRCILSGSKVSVFLHWSEDLRNVNSSGTAHILNKRQATSDKQPVNRIAYVERA